jgi:hypothetical protein
VEVPRGFAAVPFADLAPREAMPGVALIPESGLESRLVRCFSRFQGELPNARLKAITHFSMMNFQVYVELALRSHMNLSVEDSPPRRLIVGSCTLAGQDWLLPLTFGGVLVIPDATTSWAVQVRRLRELACEFAAQAVLAGTPRQLLAALGTGASQPDLMLLSLDQVLTSAESARLCRAAAAVVNSGVLVWGHEDLWPEEIGRLARPRGALRTAAE